ncbi:MAG: sigma-70 family RNA polymerase sigma factor [Chloroflexi bacterium]|nr:sigma-70 family RNA polymerase sigma factor [Chloroflexota bacterium]
MAPIATEGWSGVGADQERLWVLAAVRGDQEAFARLVEAYQGPVYNLAYRMLGNSDEAADAAQETFLRAYTRLNTYDADRKFSSWILSVASHYCVDRLRRRRPSVSMEEMDGWRWIPDAGPRPEEQTARSQRDQAIRRMLADLPPQYRLAIVLRYWHDLSYEEIATITQSTVSAVKSRLHRARLEMARRIEAAEQAEEALVQPRLEGIEECSVPKHLS